MLERTEIKSIGVSLGLILVNIALMGLLAYTPVSKLLGIMFSYAIVGIIFYGALLTGGNYFAEKGIKNEDMMMALLGAGLLQFAYGSFGAGLLAGFSANFQLAALGVTAVVTTLLAVMAGALVYGTSRDFSSWNRYSSYLFLGVLGFGLVGTFITPFLILAFICALLGFIVYLVYEIWDMKSHPGKVYLNGIGIYVAYMGVFIQVLQIILRLLSEE